MTKAAAISSEHHQNPPRTRIAAPRRESSSPAKKDVYKRQLSAYTPEERYVRHHLATKTPDVVINSVVASNLERNLYLTTELIDTEA